MRRPLTLWLLLGLCVMVGLATADPPSPPDGGADQASRELEALIRQLGDSNFAVRQSATEKLLGRPDAVPALRRALKSDDREIAGRAEVILAELARRGEKKALARLVGHAQDGRIDQAVELLVRRPEWGDEAAAWQAMTGLADRLIALAEKEFGPPATPPRKEFFPVGDYRSLVGKYHYQAQTTGRVPGINDRPRTNDGYRTQVLVRAEQVEAGDCVGDLLVSAGPVNGSSDKTFGRFKVACCVVFAGGPVESNETNYSVIVCDGDFTARESVHQCLIVAHGDVHIPEGAGECRILASGKVTLSKYPKLNQTNKVKENEPNPLGFVKWFDPASVGVVVEKAEGDVRVKEAKEGKAFAKAGLKAGDLIVAAEGKAVGSPDDFRRLLRKHLATEEELALEVRRDGQSVKMVVPVKDEGP